MKSLHPLTIFVYTVAVTSCACSFSDPLTVASALIFGIAAAALIGGRGFVPALTVALGAALAVPLFVHRGETVLFFINNRPITLEALLCGIDSGALLGAVMLWFSAYNAVMDTERNFYIFSRFTPRFGLMLSMALRFAPLFAHTYREISLTQRAMGLYSSPALSDRIGARLCALSATVTNVFENSVTTAASMKARGYGKGKRTAYTFFRFKAADAALLCIAAAGITVFVSFSRELGFWFYPKMPHLRLLPIPRLAYLGLCAIPVIAEITEKIRWKYLR